MKIENVLNFKGIPGISGLFHACGSFGVIDGDCDHTCTREGAETVYRYERDGVVLVATFTQKEDGVVLRQDHLENRTGAPLLIHNLCSRFCLDGNDYEVYTQYNGWQHESRGGWQPLVTQVTASCLGIRTCDGATPMLGLHNLHNGQNTVFHLLPNAQWQLTVRKFPRDKREYPVVEAGFATENLRLTVEVGERIELPTLIFFNAKNKTDLDAYKLHRVYNDLYPRRKMPVVYNSWLYCFDKLDIDALLEQAEQAAALGIEAFMIDAGWFGKGENWSREVGDWEENAQSGPRGRLAELSERVRALGMTFGLWFEPERAALTSRAVAEHPDFYIQQKFFDFANPAAVEHMLETVSGQIEKYQIGWVKFDFNATLPADPSGNGFYRYLRGQRRFLEELRRRFPALYITNCASGGGRMELAQGALTDSFWLSDNQGPLEGVRILKDTLKRMPTALIERWNVQRYAEGFPRYGAEGPVGVLFSCNDATWEQMTNVDPSFSEQFINGGPIGFSCDLTALSPEYRERWKAHIARFKEDRGFYMGATGRILADRPELTAIQYADPALERCVIQLFTKTVYAPDLILYPAVDPEADYRWNEEILSGKELLENGIRFSSLKDLHCYTAELFKIK